MKKSSKGTMLNISEFISDLTLKGWATNTINSSVVAIRSFFKYNDLPLGFVPLARARVVYRNRDITREELQKILAVANPREKAFFCMMVQAGLRPDTLCKLRLRDIEPDFSHKVVPCKIDVPENIAKGQYRSYFTFMGQESVDFLRAYFEVDRPGIQPDDLLFTAHGSNKNASAKSLSVIFTTTVRQLQASNALNYKRAPKGKPSEIRLYNLRKYFRKNAHQAGFELVQFWMGPCLANRKFPRETPSRKCPLPLLYWQSPQTEAWRSNSQHQFPLELEI
jgi:integrase